MHSFLALLGLVVKQKHSEMVDMMESAHQRMLKEFGELHNKLVLHCFESCVSNFNHGKLSDKEVSCISTCSSKVVNFNQRHMMNFMMHQKAQQEKAAKAAEAQAHTLKSATLKGEVTPPVLAATPQHGSAPLIPQATLTADDGTSKETAVPEKVCLHPGGGIAYGTATSHFADLFHPEASRAYTGKSIIDQFLNSGTAKLKFV